MLPDITLLDIFDFYLDKCKWWRGDLREEWYTLAHVCRQWRNVVFGSPRRLNLRLCYKTRTPVREMLDTWPLFPISIRVYSDKMWGVDDIIAALEHTDRVCELALHDFPSSQLEKVFAAMRRPFPALTCLEFRPRNETAPAIPESFLGESAPSLQKLVLCCILFPGLPKLLSSSTQLVYLDLQNISYSGCISPEAMVTCLSVLTRLKKLFIGFEYPRNRPDPESQRPPPSTRTLLPVLAILSFVGGSEYFEDIAARIDAPLLDRLSVTFHEVISDTPQLTLFIARTPKLKAHDETHGPLRLSRFGGSFYLDVGLR
jgi:hypothetical protein